MSVDDRLTGAPLAILNRHRTQDRERFAQYNLRAAEIQSVKSQLAEATARRAELAGYERQGRLFRETQRGYDQAGQPVLTRTPDTAALKKLDNRIDECRRQIAQLEASSFPTVKTAVVLERDIAAYSANIKFVAVDRSRLPLNKGERPQEALKRFRSELTALREERKAVATMQSTLAEARQRAHVQIDRIAKVPLVRNVFHGGEVDFAEKRLGVDSRNIAQHTIPDALALVAYLFGDELKARVDKLLEINADGDGISARDRAESLAQLDDNLAKLDAIDCDCVEQIIAEGGTAFHRPEANTLNVLGIAPVQNDEDEDAFSI